VKAGAGIGRVELQVESSRLDGLLFLASQSRKAVSECISDAEFHQVAS
jgi:hypothetical protein